ncbi:Nucleoporin p58/p45 [Orchesella cincta]|uniref:Nucleoporin p58/p45 n=1 Tax=Orchesella cincta TaxID=48709 RepID=A0A1D2MXB5_ORCCI|nr:Nucleoporin p58/p45 [Orchesella cincta]
MNLQPPTSAPSTGFTFGGGLGAQVQPTVAQPTAVPQNPGPVTGTMSFGGLGGVPGAGSSNTRISTLALGTDPGTGWSTRNENKAVQELPVPPEVLALVEDLKNHMKNHKTAMLEITRATDLDIDTVAEQIEEVRLGINTLTNVIHKQELQSAALMKDMQELSKDVDLVSQSRDVPAYGFGGTSSLVLNYMYDLIDKYAKRMMKYKTEIERAEFSLQTLVEASGTGLNAKDLWASLTATKDTVILLAAQIQQLHEDIRNELTFHKNLSNVLLPGTPKPWFVNADPQHSGAPPLEKLMATPVAKSGGGAANPSIDTLYNRTYSAFGRIPSVMDARTMQPSSNEQMLRTPSHDMFRVQSSLGGSTYSPNYHPSAMGSYLGPTSPAGGLKRSKK